MLSGKVMLRGSALLQTVFVRENRLEKQEYAIPFSQVVECEGVEPGDTVTIEYQTMQSQVTLLEGEAPALSCSLTGTATACFVRKLRVSVLRDMYSTRYATDCTLVLFHNREEKPFVEIPFFKEFRLGNVFSMIIFDLDYENIEYGFRMDGPFLPEEGHRFDKSRILLDPYAK